LKILEERLTQRKTDTSAIIQKRILIAAEELEREAVHNYFDYHIINDSLLETVQEIKKIILNADK
jgi:guanylate kinase